MLVDIKNEEHYYSLPGHDPNQGQQHLPVNMVYRAMIYVSDTFKSTDIQNVIMTMWEVDLSPSKIGMALSTLTTVRYVERMTRTSPYVYGKTPKYIYNLREKMRDKTIDNLSSI